MQIVQQVIHYFLHFVFPLGIAYIFFKVKWKQAYMIFLLSMLVDVDHLLASPVFHPCRCGIGFHFLHSHFSIFIYAILLLFPKCRLLAIGLLMHMGTDYIDCIFINSNCK